MAGLDSAASLESTEGLDPAAVLDSASGLDCATEDVSALGSAACVDPPHPMTNYASSGASV